MKISEVKDLMKSISSWPWGVSGREILNSNATDPDIIGHYVISEDHAIVHPCDIQFIAKSPEIVDELLRKLEVAKKALEFYADRKIHNIYYERGVKEEPVNDLRKDGYGNRSREALKELE